MYTALVQCLGLGLGLRAAPTLGRERGLIMSPGGWLIAVRQSMLQNKRFNTTIQGDYLLVAYPDSRK